MLELSSSGVEGVVAGCWNDVDSGTVYRIPPLELSIFFVLESVA